MRKFLCCLITLLLLILLICGIAVLREPYLDTKAADTSVRQAVSAFREVYPQITETAARAETTLEESTVPEPTIGEGPEILPELRQYMENYNSTISAADQYSLFLSEGFEKELINPDEYGLDSDVIGVISIPALGVEHPLRIGTSYSHLAEGFAIVSQTSMPIGGESTNCVIAGHRGWQGSPYLRDIEELEIGDKIYIENPWETLEYEVCEFRVILPEEIDNLLIQPGRDLITLYTCHPYHTADRNQRYLVYAERVLDEPAPERTQPSTVTQPTAVTAPIPATAVSPELILSDGSAFQSSEETIWLDVYGPWICLLVLFLLFLFSLFSTIRFFLRDRKK